MAAPTGIAPSKSAWLKAVEMASYDAWILPEWILDGRRHKRVVRARWAAWRYLRDMNPNYSVAGMARTTGYDHTTILWGLKRLAEGERRV